MRMRMIVPVAALLALAACGSNSDSDAGSGAVVNAAPLNADESGNAADQTNYSAAVLTQNDTQRNATFIRALQDASLPCDHVDSSTRIADQDGVPTWRATCKGGTNYIIGIPKNGVAKILSRTDR